MKRAGWTLLVVVLCAAAALFWWLSETESAHPAKTGESAPVNPGQAANADPSAAKQESSALRKQDTPSPNQNADFEAQFRGTSEMLEFARSLLGAARAGDHAAQFYIFRAFDYCADEQILYFRRRGVQVSLDDALKTAATSGWPFDTEVVRRSYARCHTMIESGAIEIGERREWLRLASDGGYPLAQVVAARFLYRDLASADRDNDEKREQRRSLVAKAVRSREPAVIWEIGNTPLGVLPSNGEEDQEDKAWYLAACQRGLDCSPQSEGVRWLCMWDRACQPYESVHDIFRRAVGDELPDLESRARWINEKIDAGDWEALGF
jgi:hypothetical protein